MPDAAPLTVPDAVDLVVGDLVGRHDPADRRLPWRDGADAWGVLVSEVMSQQTQAERVADRWREFMGRFPTPAHLAEADVAEVIARWAGLGYNRRAVNLHRAAATIAADHGGRVPQDLGSLLDLPGVGPYTARAVLAFAFDAPVLPVDTNVARILARSSGQVLDARTAQAWGDALASPPRSSSRVASALMDFGAGVCTARRPGCDGCPVASACAWAGGPGVDPAARGAHRPRPQGRFEGSLRQARGRLLSALRAGPVAQDQAPAIAGDRWEQAVDGLVADGLAVRRGQGFALPGTGGKVAGR